VLAHERREASDILLVDGKAIRAQLLAREVGKLRSAHPTRERKQAEHDI